MLLSQLLSPGMPPAPTPLVRVANITAAIGLAHRAQWALQVKAAIRHQFRQLDHCFGHPLLQSEDVLIDAYGYLCPKHAQLPGAFISALVLSLFYFVTLLSWLCNLKPRESKQDNGDVNKSLIAPLAKTSSHFQTQFTSPKGSTHT